jgi:uncharacterized tellurite resistance protein B-like protein
MTMMTSLENLHYAIGELAYAIACADGKVQKEEEQKFHDIVRTELARKDYDFDISDIVFQIMSRDKRDCATTYEWAMKEIRTNSHYLSPELKQTFISVIEKIAAAYPPVTLEEKNMIDKFKAEIGSIQGDPVYYEPVKR